MLRKLCQNRLLFGVDIEIIFVWSFLLDTACISYTHDQICTAVCKTQSVCISVQGTKTSTCMMYACIPMTISSACPLNKLGGADKLSIQRYLPASVMRTSLISRWNVVIVLCTIRYRAALGWYNINSLSLICAPKGFVNSYHCMRVAGGAACTWHTRTAVEPTRTASLRGGAIEIVESATDKAEITCLSVILLPLSC
jgi:hypothetical protein